MSMEARADQSASLQTSHSPGSQEKGVPILELQDASFSVDGRTILFPLQLAVPAGKMIGVIGHNGSGKSTLGKMLACQIRPTGGQLIVEGQSRAHFSTREFARKVAYLPQSIPSAAGMTVKELIALGRYPWLGAFRAPTAADIQLVDQSMVTTGVIALAQRLVDTLSGGERQRVWLAMLMAQQARILILDEPTSALDIKHQVEVLGLLRQLIHAHGISVVVILHDVYMAGRYCDELVALRDGCIVARGACDQILTPSALKSIYDVDMDVMIHPASGDRVVCLHR